MVVVRGVRRVEWWCAALLAVVYLYIYIYYKMLFIIIAEHGRFFSSAMQTDFRSCTILLLIQTLREN